MLLEVLLFQRERFFRKIKLYVPVVLIFGLNENRTMFQAMIELDSVRKVCTNYCYYYF